MKHKKIMISIGIVCACIAGIAVYIWHLTGNGKEESPFQTVNQWDFVYMDEKEQTEEGFDIGVYVNSDKKIYDKLFYYLEEKGEDGKWYTIPFKSGVDEQRELNAAKAYFMPYGEENPYGDENVLFATVSVRYLDYYDALPKGDYRLVFPICYEEGIKEITDYRTVEFTLEQDMEGYGD